MGIVHILIMYFHQIVEEMSASNCALFVENGCALAQQIDLLISNDTLRTSLITNGTTYVMSQSQVVENVKAEILLVQNSRAEMARTNAAT